MTNQLGYDKPLYMLAFDHRGSFQRGLFGIEADPSAGEVERISDAKRLIFEAFELVFGEADDEGSLGLLVDEQFGAEVARRAKRLGAVLAMPVERSGQPEFDFEFGDDFGTHIEAFDPSFAKVLVRYNAEDDAEMNARQAGRLRRLAEWLHEREHKFLFELPVPATDEQLQRVGGDAGRYDLEIRPELVIEAIRELQEAGVEADI
jgi:myo-inositol catabolism protein IolC